MTLELLEERVDPTGVPPEYQPEINLDPMTLWLNEAARSPLLTHQEELLPDPTLQRKSSKETFTQISNLFGEQR